MRNVILLFLLLLSATSLWAEEVPTLLILTTESGQVEIPIASIQKITYDKAGTTMYVNTNAGTDSYLVASITQMTLSNVPEVTALTQLTDSPVNQFTKFEKDGVVYVVKDGKIYTMKGEQK